MSNIPAPNKDDVTEMTVQLIWIKLKNAGLLKKETPRCTVAKKTTKIIREVLTRR